MPSPSGSVKLPPSETFNHTLIDLRDRIAAAVTAEQILGWRFTDTKRLKDFVEAEQWYGALLRMDKPKSVDYVAFCSQFVTSLYAQGLNEFDGALALRAARDSQPTLAKHATGIARDCEHVALDAGLSATEWRR